MLHNSPGSVYVGQLTGPWHQVHHVLSAEDELLNIPGLGPCSVTVMARTALFPYGRARGRGATPCPTDFFEALAEGLRDALASSSWRLPMLAEVIEFHQKLAPSPCSGASGSKRARSG